MVTTHKKSKTKTHNFKKGGKQKKSMEYHQTKTADRNRKEKIQWRNRATRKQQTKWLQEILIHQ